MTGFLGGVCLVVRHFLDNDVLQWLGFGLLGVAALSIGLMLVPKAPVWLQAIVGLGVVGLAGSVLVTLHSELDADSVDLVIGIVAVLLFAVLAVRWRRARQPRAHGSHSR
ncbi:hypothetical protein [Nocardioides jensenii]|uniref:hypothetical protein n=1 Tax=Nocardioides jensenii TaxID=1843 RepID=UPI0008337144|nr:hypothetical protein [Nocardioides jensenii]